jgi:hypothetical protein
MTSENKRAFFNLVSEYLTLEGDGFKVYKLDSIGIDNVKWFLEMLWSVSEIYDVRILSEDDGEGKIKIILRTGEKHWRLHA